VKCVGRDTTPACDEFYIHKPAFAAGHRAVLCAAGGITSMSLGGHVDHAPYKHTTRC
jgi:hypothetical protein